VLDQARRTQRYQAKRRDDEGQLTQSMLELVRQHPRYGYRRIWALLRNGWQVNRKRVHRLWKQNGLKVPVKRHKKRRLAKALGLSWRLEYNHRRPHGSLRYRTPAQFAATQAEPPIGRGACRRRNTNTGGNGSVARVELRGAV
jgi:transposase InsO family protein